MQQLRRVGRRPYKIWKGKVNLSNRESIDAYKERFPGAHLVAEFPKWLVEQREWLIKELEMAGLPELNRRVEYRKSEPGKWDYIDDFVPSNDPDEDIVRSRTVLFLRDQPVGNTAWYIGHLENQLSKLERAYEENDIARACGRSCEYGSLKYRYTSRFKVEEFQDRMKVGQGKSCDALDGVNAGKKAEADKWRKVAGSVLIRYPLDVRDSYTKTAEYVLKNWPKGGAAPPKPATIARYLGWKYPRIT